MADGIKPVESPFPAEMVQRKIGHYQCKIAAARMLEQRGHIRAAMDVLSLEVDKYLTLEEIARREAPL